MSHQSNNEGTGTLSSAAPSESSTQKPFWLLGFSIRGDSFISPLRRQRWENVIWSRNSSYSYIFFDHEWVGRPLRWGSGAQRTVFFHANCPAAAVGSALGKEKHLALFCFSGCSRHFAGSPWAFLPDLGKSQSPGVTEEVTGFHPLLQLCTPPSICYCSQMWSVKVDLNVYYSLSYEYPVILNLVIHLFKDCSLRANFPAFIDGDV